MTPGLYVYGIVETGSLAAPIHAQGIFGVPVALLESGGLIAVVTGVDVSEFEGETLERNVASPEWLEQQVRAHECVLDTVVASTSVIPMRFGSIFSSPTALYDMLVSSSAALRAALDSVRGRIEWGVKLHCDRSRLVESLSGGGAETASGRGYLMQKKAQLEAGERAARAAAEVAGLVHASLGAVAEKAVLVPPRSGETLNGAYLVADTGRDAFMARVDELQRSHGDAYVFEVTGPWPPYNFARADVGGAS